MFQTTFWMFAKLFGAFIKNAGTFGLFRLKKKFRNVPFHNGVFMSTGEVTFV